MTLSRTRVVRTLMLGMTLGITAGLACAGLASAADGAEPPAAEDVTPAESSTPPTEPAAEPAPPTTVPESTVPETTVAAPETTVPESTVPETTVPEATLPETTAPASTVAQGTDVATNGAAETAPTETASTEAEPPAATTALSVEAAASSVSVVPGVFYVSATQGEIDGNGNRLINLSWSGTPGADFDVERQLSGSGTWEPVGSTWDGSTSMQDTLYEGWDTFGWYQYRVTPWIFDYQTYDYVYGAPSYASINVTSVAYPPSLPRSVRVTRTSTTAQVTWTAPTTNDYECESTGYSFCDPATSYVVSWAPSGGAWQSVTTTATSRTISGLSSTTTYYVTVRAVNAAGESGTTTSVRVDPVAAVTGLRATQGENEYGTVKHRVVNLSWSGTPGAEYDVERRLSTSTKWDWVGSVSGGSTSITDAFEDWDTFGWYQYRVTPSVWDVESGDVSGSPAFVSINVTGVAYPPSLPRSVRVTRTSTALKVTWTAPTTDDYYCESTGYSFCDPATSYVVSWAPSGGAWQRATTTATSRTLSGLSSTTTYYVNVQAVNAAGRSGVTTSVRVDPILKPSAMAQMDATPGNRLVRLYWTAPASNGSPISRYAIQRRPAGSSTWTYISTNTAATARSFTAGNLTNGRKYYFRIAAVNAIGMGAWNYPVSATPRTVPSAVSWVNSGSGSSTVTMTWGTPASDGGARLRFYRVQEWAGWYWRTIDTTSYRSMTLINFYGCHTLRVAAVNDAGTGSYRSIDRCGARPPGAVPGLRAYSGYNTVTLTWDNPWDGGDWIRRYRVEISEWYGWRLLGNTSYRSMTVYNVRGCQNFRVAAENGGFRGAWSFVTGCARW